MSSPTALSKPQELVEWLKANGGHFHTSAELKVDPQFGLSVFSTSPIKEDDVLVSCPFELAITAQLASEAVSEVKGIEEEQLVWPAGTSKEGEKWNERMRIGAYLGLHWVHADVKSDAPWPPALKHKIYLESLPSPPDLTTPMYFTDSELNLLQGSNLLGAVEYRKREWKAEQEAVWSVLKEDGLTWWRYLAIATYMSSRSFPSKLLKIPEGQKSQITPAEKRKVDEEEEVSQPVLLPGVDIFNHARNQPILWLSSPVQSTSAPNSDPIPSISLVSTQGSDAGVQLFNNYGAKPNEELLLGYGFVIPSNPEDTVNLRLGKLGNLPEHVTKKLAEKKLDASKRFELRRDGDMDKELLEVVRIMLNDHDPDHEHEEIDEDDEHALHAHEEEEMQLELDVLGMLGGMLDDKLAKLQGEATEPETGTSTDSKAARAHIREMCEIYRQGERA
ncbi:cytoplasmic protein [Kwoniella heveanensis BCC8398]|uniref:Cytoplasmic protein n=1 Tax=Kwoniella heveanensis BCC8398 TaxID=1296120 RepID=A0A1B9GP46_9TREE|nr:cytoplasmic protein [Kwoniella heveanensis BCC8398]